MNFYIITFRCKVNQCESEYIREAMLKNEFCACVDMQKAEAFIINSCTVTGESDRKLRQMINKIKKTIKIVF